MCEIVSGRGQVAVPQRVLKRLRLKPGSVVDFIFDADGRSVMVKANKRRKLHHQADHVGLVGRVSNNQWARFALHTLRLLNRLQGA
jgi:bifunctional DNA-binding transcriptional regulator/antitoxin component of YhaV-PrlF toxin-antitoxin module